MTSQQLVPIPVLDDVSVEGVGTASALYEYEPTEEEILNTLRIPILHCNVEIDLEKISTFTNHAKVIEGPVAILYNFNLMKAD